MYAKSSANFEFGGICNRSFSKSSLALLISGNKIQMKKKVKETPQISKKLNKPSISLLKK